MLNPEEIHNKAEKERQKQVLKDAEKNRAAAPKAYTPLEPGNWKVFHSINPRAAGFGVWILIPWMLAVTGWMLLLINNKQFGWIVPYAAILTILPVAVYLAALARELAEYQTYKSWIKDPGLPLTGWNEVAQTGNFPQLLYWDKLVTVTVKVKPATPTETIKLIDDVLYLFAIAATKTFYKAWYAQPGASGDRRNKWILKGSLTVQGSANSDTMGLIYFLLKKELHSIQQQTNAIEIVSIGFSKEVFEVKPVPVRSVHV